MKKKIALATLSILPLAVSNAYATGQVGTVTIASLNVRSGAGTSYNILFTVNKNDRVDIIQSSNGWYKIKTNSGKEGWAYSRYISTSEAANNDTINNVTKTVNINGLNIRSGAGTIYRVIATLSKGHKVEVISENNGWTKIKHDKRIGYVATKYLDSQSSNNSINISKEVTTLLNVRSGPGANYGILGKLNKGSKVQVIAESNGWSKINFNGKIAYVSTGYLRNVSQPSTPNPPSTDGGGIVNYTQLNYTLQDHVKAQYDRANIGGNVIDSSRPRSTESLTTYSIRQARAFVPANISDLEYFLNTDNFTSNKKGMLQFLRIDNYKNGVSIDELNSYLNSLPPTASGTNVFYNQGEAFINAAKKYNIDVIYLVSHSMWETAYGKSTLAQGQTLTSYKGQTFETPVTVYNFFGIGAIDKSANVSGAEAAYSNGWTSVESTIDGSARWIAQNYIKNSKYNQNTLYKMKFNYNYTWHQYATDVNWSNGISGIMYNLIGMYDSQSSLVYDVPNYKK